MKKQKATYSEVARSIGYTNNNISHVLKSLKRSNIAEDVRINGLRFWKLTDEYLREIKNGLE